MVGRTPGNIVAVRPMKDGVIADFDMTEAKLRSFVDKGYKRRSLSGPGCNRRPRASRKWKSAVIDAALSAGLRTPG